MRKSHFQIFLNKIFKGKTHFQVKSWFRFSWVKSFHLNKMWYSKKKKIDIFLRKKKAFYYFVGKYEKKKFNPFEKNCITNCALNCISIGSSCWKCTKMYNFDWLKKKKISKRFYFLTATSNEALLIDFLTHAR